MHTIQMLALAVAILTQGSQDKWPQRFVWAEGTNHAYIVLYRDGTAAYSERMTGPARADRYFAASNARWNWCEPAAGGSRCIQVHVEGYSDDRQSSFRFDYWYARSSIVEFDKGGVRRALQRLPDGQQR